MQLPGRYCHTVTPSSLSSLLVFYTIIGFPWWWTRNPDLDTAVVLECVIEYPCILFNFFSFNLDVHGYLSLIMSLTGFIISSYILLLIYFLSFYLAFPSTSQHIINLQCLSLIFQSPLTFNLRPYLVYFISLTSFIFIFFSHFDFYSCVICNNHLTVSVSDPSICFHQSTCVHLPKLQTGLMLSLA